MSTKPLWKPAVCDMRAVQAVFVWGVENERPSSALRRALGRATSKRLRRRLAVATVFVLIALGSGLRIGSEGAGSFAEMAVDVPDPRASY